jgi:hypothetical protein
LSFSFLAVFEHWFSKKPHTPNNLSTILINAGMVLILLLTIASLALSASGDQFDDDPSFLEIASLGEFASFFLLGSLFPGLALAVLFTILRLEFLRSHIGEKRPAPADCGLELASKLCSLQTASTRLCSAVFLFLVPVAAGSSNLVFVRERSTRSRSKKRFRFIEEVCKYA